MGEISSIMDSAHELLEKANAKPKPKFEAEESYLLSVISSEGYENCPYYTACETPEQKAAFSFAVFKAEYSWAIEQKGIHRALSDWLSGLPSSVNVEYRNHLIIALAESWGQLSPNDRQSKIDGYLNRWFSMMAMRLIGLWRKHGVMA